MFYSDTMERRVPIRELNQRTSAILNDVAAGAVIVITRSGRPVARLVPIDRDTAVLNDLVAGGRAIAAELPGPMPLPPVYGDPELDVAAALAADRDEERY
jgi:prevent-host-death family protein